MFLILFVRFFFSAFFALQLTGAVKIFLCHDVSRWFSTSYAERTPKGSCRCNSLALNELQTRYLNLERPTYLRARHKASRQLVSYHRRYRQ
jgi:hypothetical protein